MYRKFYKDLCEQNNYKIVHHLQLLQQIYYFFQSKIRELEKKAELQNVRHEELMLEMAAIKRCAQNKSERTCNTSTVAWKKSGLHQEVQTSPDSVPSTPG